MKFLNRIPRSSRGIRIIGVASLLFLAGGLILSLSLQISALNRRISGISTSIATEVERQNQLTQLLEGNQRTAVRQLQETRELLNLPVTEFRFSHHDSSGDGTREDPREPRELLALGAQRIREEQHLRHMRETLREAVDSSGDLQRLLTDLELEVRASGPRGWRVLALHQGAPEGAWLNLHIEEIGDGIPRRSGENPSSREGPREPRIRITAPQGAEEGGVPHTTVALSRLPGALATAITAQQEYFAQRDNRQSALRTALETPSVAAALEQQGLTTRFRDSSVQLVNGSGAVLLEIDSFTHEQTPAELAATILELDTRPEEERRVDISRQKMETLAQDDAAAEYLAELGLRLDGTPRETLDFFMYDLRDTSGAVIGSFGVLKFHGDIYLLDADQVVITSLETLAALGEELPRPAVTDAARARELPADFPPGFRGGAAARHGTNLLLIGTHETKADAIMLVNLSPERTIRIISIPRDIYYRGRKLSDHHELYGPRVFVSRVEEIIRQEIDGYVAIDMYAFIEVVDLLGGITITLDEPLRDPTYRVRDNGQWGTLYFAAGTHTLSGVQALRVARSRATTTDFGRSERQHQILDALRRRFNELHAGNLDQLYQLVRIMHRYLDTDLSAYDMTQYILAYRNAPIVNRAGMTFDNILYSTYSNVYNQGLSFDELPDDFFMGLWILLPRDDNWNIIPWFVERELQRG